MLIPLRAGDEGLLLTWDLGELFAVLPRPNIELERIWAGLLTVVRDSWPDWPVEVWAHIHETTEEEGEAPTFSLSYAVFFAGEGRGERTAATMASFVISAFSKAMPLDPASSWGGIDPDWKPLWAIDDGVVHRLLASEGTVERSVYMIGSYSNLPTLFAASLEAWPLKPARRSIGLELADCDMGWVFR